MDVRDLDQQRRAGGRYSLDTSAFNSVRRLGALGVEVGVSGYSTPVLFHLVMFREMQTRSFHPAPLDRYPRLAVVVKTT